MQRIRAHLLQNIELYLAGLSVAVALAIPFAIEVGTNDQELAASALAACVFQGLVLWMMRRRHRQVRQEIIAELRAMLKDRINNHLTVVLMSVSHRRRYPGSEHEREQLQLAIAATNSVARVLDELSMESLRLWKAKYRDSNETAEEVRNFVAYHRDALGEEPRAKSTAGVLPRDRGAAETRIRR